VVRFQVNRALAGSAVVHGRRRHLRAPTNWEVGVIGDGGRKEAGIYTVSSAGAFVSTPTPSQRGARVTLELPLLGRRRLSARVVSTNVPGNLVRRDLPVGMAVAFDEPDIETQARLHLFAEERLALLAV
jgi:hypothetical protein